MNRQSLNHNDSSLPTACKNLFAFILFFFTAVVGAEQDSSLPVMERAPILIENVLPLDKSFSESAKVNVHISDGVIKEVSSSEIEPPADAISVDGGGRFIFGDLTVGKAANVIVMDEDPAADLTMLTDSSNLFLVVRAGVIELDNVPEVEVAEQQPELLAIDPSRYKLIRVKKDPWYSYRSDRFTVRFAGGVLLDRTSFGSKDEVETQVGDLNSYDSGEVRTIRLGAGGFFKVFDRNVGFVLVAADNAFDRDYENGDDEFEWLDWALATEIFSGVRLAVGKQKESFSHFRKQLLVDQPFMERPMAVNALLPSRNTGVSLSGVALEGRLGWSAGTYFDMLDDRDEPFEDSKQHMGRITALPYLTEQEEQLLHLGFAYRYSDVGSAKLRFTTGPEVYSSPAFVDTGEFSASNSVSTNFELGYKYGPVWIMSEFIRTEVDANELDDPTFDGFHVSGTWALTGEQRGYDKRAGIFGKLTPVESVRTGGIGAWELVGRYSEIDLSDGQIDGGESSRVSLGINWWPTREFKGTIQYGWIDLDRFGIKSSSNVIQLRGAFLLGF